MKQSFAIYDRNGIPVLPGDTIKIYAYTAALRREKVYSYNRVNACEASESLATLIRDNQKTIERLSDVSVDIAETVADALIKKREELESS